MPRYPRVVWYLGAMCCTWNSPSPWWTLDQEFTTLSALSAIVAVCQDNISTMRLIARTAPVADHTEHIDTTHIWLADRVKEEERGCDRAYGNRGEEMCANVLTRLPAAGSALLLREREREKAWLDGWIATYRSYTASLKVVLDIP